MKKEMVRVNTRISQRANEWLDEESNETGIPKSTLILLAIENFIKEREVIRGMGNLTELDNRMQTLENAVKRNDPS